MTLKEIELCLFILVIVWLCVISVQWLTKNETFLYFYRVLRVPGQSPLEVVGSLFLFLSKDFGKFGKWAQQKY